MEVAIAVSRYPERQCPALTVCVALPEAVTLISRQAVFAQILSSFSDHHTLNHYLHQVLETVFSFRMLA